MTKKPTIHELEDILSNDEKPDVAILPDGSVKVTDFKQELEGLINSFSKENGSDTPDWILAQYLSCCLNAFDEALVEREQWFGRKIGYPFTPPPKE